MTDARTSERNGEKRERRERRSANSEMLVALGRGRAAAWKSPFLSRLFSALSSSSFPSSLLAYQSSHGDRVETASQNTLLFACRHCRHHLLDSSFCSSSYSVKTWISSLLQDTTNEESGGSNAEHSEHRLPVGKEGKAKFVDSAQEKDSHSGGNSRNMKRLAQELKAESAMVRDISTCVINCFAEKRKEELKSKTKHMVSRVWTHDKSLSRKEAMALAMPPGLVVLDIKASSGLRAMRHALEVDDVSKVYANELDTKAYAALKRNVALNDLEDKVEVMQTDARILMLQKPEEYDVIEVDPYGEPVAFLDSAVQSVCDGGLLCVTSMGLNNLCAQVPEICWAKYNTQPLISREGDYSSEMAIRILLYSIQSHALRHKRYIAPILSLSLGSKVLTFVRIYSSATQIQMDQKRDGATKVSYVYQCGDCNSFSFQPVGIKRTYRNQQKFAPGGLTVGEKCEICDGQLQMGGPIWTEAIHDMSWIRDMQRRLRRDKDYYSNLLPSFNQILDLLARLREELMDVPMSVSVSDLTKILKCSPPSSDDLRSSLANAGYRVSSTHDSKSNIKTDAPFPVIWDIMKCYILDHPPPASPEENTPGHRILLKPPKFVANFSRVPKVVRRRKFRK